jgi:radical SAM superfamily enzyme YgiQ (UPF0313 family)
LLLSPRGPLYRHKTGAWKKSLRYMPLTLTTLAALVPPELELEVELFDEGIRDIDRDCDADLVGISAITGTAPRSYELADHFRKRGIPVVLGGVHPTLVPDEAARHANSVVVGYAEDEWPRLLRDWSRGEMAKKYTQKAGLSLADRPFPLRNSLPRDRYTTPHTFEATRGCVHRCEFCVVPSAWGRPIQKPVADVVADIKQMGSRRLIFLDLNIIADIEYAKELFTALIPLNIVWGGLATVTLAFDDELLDLAAKSGCRGILIGFESLSPDSLGETNKKFNARKDYMVAVQKLHERDIAIMGCFVFGFDHDDRDTFDATVDFVLESKIDLPRYAILTPFPGTPLFARLKSEGRILTDDWSLFDGQHVVFQPAQMSPRELLLNTEAAWKRTYSVRNIWHRLSGSRTQLATAIPTNLGYRFYAHRLHQYYNCDWMLAQAPELQAVAGAK